MSAFRTVRHNGVDLDKAGVFAFYAAQMGLSELCAALITLGVAQLDVDRMRNEYLISDPNE